MRIMGLMNSCFLAKPNINEIIMNITVVIPKPVIGLLNIFESQKLSVNPAKNKIRSNNKSKTNTQIKMPLIEAVLRISFRLKI